jgi:hypothetical protein
VKSTPDSIARELTIRAVQSWLALAGVSIATAARLVQLTLAWQSPGLFSYIGYDFGNLWAQAWVFVANGMPAAYDVSTVSTLATPILDSYRQLIGQAQGNPPLEVLPGPYPPIVILLLAPTTLLPAYWAFAGWVAIDLAALGYIAWHLAQRFPGHKVLAFLAPVSFYPLTEALILGQPTVLLMFALFRGYLSLERGRDFRAGLWLGILLIKPQFALVLGLVLLFNHRWKSVLGFAMVGVIIAASSIVLLGGAGIQAYVSVFSMFSGFRLTPPGVLPELGITWHAFLLNILPDSVSESQGRLLTVLISILTLALLPIVWRGTWDTTNPRFAIQVFASMVITMLVAYHNHVHGATMLVVPAGFVLASRAATRPLRWAVWAGLFTHPVLFVLSRAFALPIRISLAYILLMAAALAIVSYEQLRGASRAKWPLLARHPQHPAP